jgi:protein SCO1
MQTFLSLWRGLVVLCAALLLACTPDAPKFNTTDITGAPFAKTLALTDHTGKPQTLENFKGKVVLVSFGFTHCPDVCPTTLANWAEAIKQLGDAGKDVQGLFVTVDPERDTPALLSQYVPAFNPTFLGLLGNAEQTKAAATEFKVIYQKAAGATPETYTVDHSTATYVFDRAGRVRLMATHNTPVSALTSDLKVLLAQK